MCEKPSVWIIVNFHNANRFLNETLASLEASRYCNLVIFLFDNFSDDGSERLAASFAESNPDRCLYKRSEDFLNLGSARANALEMCTGEFVLFIDSDDLLLSDGIDHLIEAAVSNPERVVFGGGANIVDESGKLLSTSIPKSWPVISVHSRLAMGSVLVQQSTLFRRSAVSEAMLQNLRYFEYCPDYYLWVSLCALGEPVLVHHLCASYRYHGNSLSVSKRNRMGIELIQAWTLRPIDRRSVMKTLLVILRSTLMLGVIDSDIEHLLCFEKNRWVRIALRLMSPVSKLKGLR
jgi:glycosyltransferase involved in cell wall biosynthesis